MPDSMRSLSGFMKVAEPKNIPSCYIPGYARAQALDPEMAANYIAHTHIGDPDADAVIEQMASLDGETAARLFKLGLNTEDPLEREHVLRDAPSALRDFLRKLDTRPDWVDTSAYMPGIRMFHRNSRLVLGAFVGGVLIEGFSTNISKSFMVTGRLRQYGVRRLKQNNRHMIELFMPGGMERIGDGWKLSVRVRLIHAQIRYLLKKSTEWDTEELGVPLSAAHMAFSAAAFSARLLKHLESLGAEFNDEERKSFMNIWRHSGFLMGVPETVLFRDEEEALRLFDVGRMCEPISGPEAIAMANSLINSAPLVIGVTEGAARYALTNYVYRVSRALIGNTLANELKYPSNRTFGVLQWFRFQSRYAQMMNRLFQKRNRDNNFSQFTSLLEASAFDENGISYRLPDDLYAEKSRQW